MFNLIWMVMTAPMKNEMRSTIPMEFIPSCTISFKYCLKNILMRSGRESVRPISIRYFPTVAIGFKIIVFIIDAKLALFVGIFAKERLILCSIARILNFFRIFVGKIKSMSELGKDIQQTEHVVGTPDCMVLRAEGLVKKYGKRTVVNGANFYVKQGEIVGLLGPNGAGKTTSFYMTTGLVVPNAGHVYLNDLEITDYPVYKHAKAGIGYLAQEASVFRKMSVEDNIASVLELTGKPISEQNQSESDRPFDILPLAIDIPRTELFDRLEKRVHQMILAGLVQEVTALVECGLNEQMQSMQGIGYKEFYGYLAGEKTLEETLEEIKQGSRRYAKRQLTWFRRNKDIHWLNPGEDILGDALKIIKEQI
jgi:hypothetical protein